MPIRVRTPDGSVAVFPDGTDDATITRVMAAEYGGPKAKPKRSLMQDVTGAMSQFNAFLPGGDELAAAGNTAVDVVRGKTPLSGVVEGFKGSMAKQRGFEADIQQARPKTAALSRGMGMAAGALVPAGQTANAFSQGSRAVNMARGATTAGLTAAGYAAADRGTVRERIGAASRASVDPLTLGLGAAGGALAPAASRQAKPKLTEAEEAAKILRERAKADPAAMRAKAESMRAAGVQPNAIDVAGEKGRRLVRAVGVKGDDAGEALTANARMMSASTKPAVIERTRALDPDPRTADQMVEDLFKARDKAATANYRDAYQTPVELNDDMMRALMDEPGKSALRRARTAAVARMDDSRVAEIDALLRAEPPAGPFDWFTPRPESVSAATLDRTRIAMRERAQKAAAGSSRDLASGLNARAGMIDDTLEQVPALKPARADYRAKSQAIGVLGKERVDPFSTDPGDYGRWLQTLSPEAKQANKIALRQEITDWLSGQRTSSMGSLDELSTAPYAQANIRQVFGDDGDAYLRNITARLEQNRNASFVSPNAGSRTAVLENDTANAAKGAIGAAVDVARGNVVGITTRLVDWFASRGVPEQQAAALARVSVDPAKLNELIKAVERQMGPNEAQSLLQALDRATTAPQAVTATSGVRQQGAARLSRAAGAAGGQNAFAPGARP